MPQDERTTKVDFKLDERHYRELLTYLPEGVGITDMEENLIFVNDEFAAMLGYEREELLGMNLYNLIRERDKDLIDGASV